MWTELYKYELCSRGTAVKMRQGYIFLYQLQMYIRAFR